MVIFCTAFTVISVFVIASDFVIINLSRFCGRILITAFRCALYTGKFFFAIFFSVNLIQFCARIRCSILQIYPEASWFCCKFRFLRRGQIKGIVFRKCLTVISCFIYRGRFDLISDIFLYLFCLHGCSFILLSSGRRKLGKYDPVFSAVRFSVGKLYL